MVFIDIEPRSAATSFAPWASAASLTVALLMAAPAAMAADAAPGLRIVKDPVTGELRAPSADEAAALDIGAKGNGAARSAPRGLLTGRVNPPAIRHPDGTVEQELDESSLSYSVATRGPGGRLNTYCVTGPDAAAAILKGNKGLVKSAKEANRDDK